jgi:hypothetical protein
VVVAEAPELRPVRVLVEGVATTLPAGRAMVELPPDCTPEEARALLAAHHAREDAGEETLRRAGQLLPEAAGGPGLSEPGRLSLRRERW